MRPPREPVFLARDRYRRRRLMDAARLLPVLAGFVFLVPMLWAVGSRTTVGYLYLFGAWLLLILLAGVLSRGLSRLQDKTDDPEAP